MHDPHKEMYLMSIGYRTKTPALTKAKFINDNMDLNKNLYRDAFSLRYSNIPKR